jgi:hypothetical protein
VLPGDNIIPAPIGSLTHAITIDRTPSDVWPWLAQMGAGCRAGWYSYGFVDNAGYGSADRIIPELQNLSVGMLFPALPGTKDGFNLVAFEANRFLVIGWRSPDAAWLMTWAFVLERDGHSGTRLIVRARGGPQYRFYGLPWWLARRVVSLIHGIMQRKQLLGIARRAEQLPRNTKKNTFHHMTES